jgi:hypothetical protein
MPPRYISIHYPKTGGTSLCEAFRSAFTPEQAIFNPPDDDPGNPLSKYSLEPRYFHRTGPLVAPPIELIHGHFPAVRYAMLDNAFFLTFLRHPVEWMISLFVYYRLSEDDGNPIRVSVARHNLSVIETARIPQIRWSMSRFYFGDFDTGRLDFIGDMASYADDLERLSRLMGRPLPLLHLLNSRDRSVTELTDANYYSMLADRKLCAALQDILIDDIRFYEKASARRQNLTAA